MIIFLKRSLLLFIIIAACLFMVYLMLPEAAQAHTAGPEGAQQQAIAPTTIVPTTVPTVTPSPTATATPSPTPTPVPTTEPGPTPTATATPTPTATATVVPTPTPPAGGNTNTTSSPALNYVIFTMGGVGLMMVVVGVILYFVYSRPGL